MATIFLTMSRGGTARNILQTNAFKILKESGARIIILTPAYQDERFIKEFASDNVYFEKLVEPGWTRLDKFFTGLNKALVYNRTTMMRDRYGVYDTKETSFLRYAVKKMIFLPLSKLSFLKEAVRFLDAILVKDRYYAAIFEKYNPDIVFATSVMEDADVFVLKQAKERGIKTIGMAKSWDNGSKMVYRARVDKLIVWSDYTKDEAAKFQNYKKGDIIICGIPQFDFYKNPEYLMSKEDFFREMGISPDKKIILFASEGKISKNDGEIAEMIAEAINSGRFSSQAILMIRPHFMYLDDEKKFDKVSKMPNVLLDGGYDRSMVFKDKWDYSKKQIKHFVNLMRHADIIITTASTISLDAIAFDGCVINIAFDGYAKAPFADSVARWYLSEYTSGVVETGAVWMVDNKNELLSAINSYLENPQLLSEGRKKLRDYFCEPMDGRSGERIGTEVLNHLNDNKK